MNIREEIEVGKIPHQIFQLYCVNALSRTFAITFDEQSESPYNNEVYINLLSPTQFEVWSVSKHRNDEVTSTILYRIEYVNNSTIVIDSESEIETHYGLALFNSEARDALDENYKKQEDCINKIQKLEIDFLLSGFAKSLKSSSAVDIYQLYPPLFNPISCFSQNSNKIEHLRLTPHCSFISIRDKKKYNSYKAYSRKQGITPCKEDGYCVSKDVNKHDLGAVYSFCREKIVKIASAHSKETWLPINSLIANTKISINTPLYVKPTESESEGEWLYIATNGIIYGDTIIKAAMEYKVIEAEKGPIELIIYKDENQELMLPLVANELVLIRGNELESPIVLDIERVVEKDIFASESEEFTILKANIEELNNSLIDRNYYDGTQFEELLTYEFLEMKREEERRQRKKEEMQASVKEGIDKLKQFTDKTIGQLKQVTDEKVGQIRQQNDSTLKSNPNENKSGGFNEYYQKHKTGVLIGVGLILFLLLLISTCI